MKPIRAIRTIDEISVDSSSIPRAIKGNNNPAHGRRLRNSNPIRNSKTFSGNTTFNKQKLLDKIESLVNVINEAFNTMENMQILQRKKTPDTAAKFEITSYEALMKL